MLNRENDTPPSLRPSIVHTPATPVLNRESTMDCTSAPPLMTTIRLVVGSWLAAAALPVFLLLILGPPTYSGIMGYLCIMIVLHIGLAAFLGFTGAVARSWVVTVAGALPLAAAPWAAAIISDFLSVWQSPLATITDPERASAIGLSSILTLSAAVFAHWTKAVALKQSSGVYCKKCDYNLTGNVSGKCPECGTPLDKFTIAK